MFDRFNLEEEIMNVWHTKDDLDAIAERIYDDPNGPMSEDAIVNVLTGLSELHETRCKKLFNIFESIVHAGGFKKIEDFAYEKEFEDLDSEREVRPKDF
jgi:wyosine [tRNA(Phe)-imidazoG37] synthetase (radical SAM superfamily)